MPLIPVFGEYSWSPETKYLYYETGLPVGRSTYERAVSKAPWYNFWQADRPLNPSHYATKETAMSVLIWAKNAWPALSFSIRGVLTSGNVTHPEYALVVGDGHGLEEQYNVGLLAFTKDKNGDGPTKYSFEAELRLARII